MSRIGITLALLALALGTGSTATQAASKTTPYGEKPHAIPGKIEAEHFDKGDAETAYHDEEKENLGENYREPTQVDIEKRSDASNGHGVGWTRKGEWLIYSVEVKEPGEYTIEMPVASDKRGGTFHIEFDGKDVTGPIHVPDTGGWQKLKVINHPGVKLQKGKFAMKIMMDEEGPSGSIADVDYLKFIKRK